MTTFKFKITNVTCAACIKLSTMALKTIPGVLKLKIEDDGTGELVSGQETSWDQIVSALESVDKTAILL